ncbi:probable bifunctional methylthioribulose-1-phosphate dehydratase/enolase-phosphatase E1 2 isoform X3 [Ziziphus jujuba]|uniref:Probable bifunctional methylthioribulose-1-phosphate dehydratase/enolase-phosphatase E1 2 isoform X3 n=1 Tax=Ziziphus jujuba TaxID=326968 RepID=A0ABM3IFE5_ZIZJJ|nr:probable bifunctional methylthioribulose-1-phosphate dehydratase/enolase-phosphatase E1 2 isoform X3 [Ziziphus jujuba]
MEAQEHNEHTQEKKMLPPPVGTFQTREELIKHVRDFALTQGYMVSIRDSSKDRYVTLACDRGGVYRKRLKTGENLRKRKSESRLTNCSFEVVGKKDDDIWILSIKNGVHNHEASNDTSDHPSCRRFSEEEVKIIRELTAAGKRPRQILKALRQKNPNLVSDSRNVYNVKAKIRREMVSGKKMGSSGGVATTLTTLSEPMVQNGVAGTGSSQAYLERKAVTDTRALAAELCRHFYTLGWFSGTGGSIAIKVHDDAIPKPSQLIVTSPSGVQKERMVTEDMYVLSSDGFILLAPVLKAYPHMPPQCTDCAPLFMKVFEMCDAGAVIHSHGMESCIVTLINPLSKEFRITHMEMIKGIQGHSYHDELVVPIIENAAHEGELIESLVEAAECYHYLFDAAIKLHQSGLDWTTPSHGPICNVNGFRGCGGNYNRALKAGPLSLNYMTEPSQHCILLDIEGTIIPISFISDVLFPYTHDNVEKHLAATYDSEETQIDISLLRSQIETDLERGITGAVPIPPDYVGKELVIGSVVENVVAMIKNGRKVAALKQLQGHICRTGFQRNQLVGVVFDDVAEALERWQNSGIKVYIYCSDSREAQQLLANSNYGDLRKYFCGYFDTTVGNKEEIRSYLEILRMVGVDKPTNILFVTDIFQEASAARDAGLEVMMSIRPGNAPLPQNHGFRTIESLLEI